MKIAFILPNLLTGGSQRAMVNIARGLLEYKINVLLIVINDVNQHYRNNPGIEKNLVSNYNAGEIRTIYLNKRGIKYSIISINKIVNIERPDILFSSITYLNLYLSLFRPFLSKKFQLVCRETNILSVKHKVLGIPWYYNYLITLSYKNTDYFICQSEDMRIDLIENFGVPIEKISVVHNPVNVEQLIKLRNNLGTELNVNKYNITSVGHLTIQKGQDKLIRALHLIDDTSIHLHIIGRGPRLTELKELTRVLGLNNQVTFHGFMSNPYELVSRSDLFVLPSQFEGFPNALIEAGVLGVPMVANDCKGGIREILNEKYGYIYEFNSIEDLKIKICEARNKDWERSQISRDFIMRFRQSTICTKYMELFNILLRNRI